DLIDTDNVHMTGRGHGVVADLLAGSLGIPSRRTARVAAPPPDVIVPPSPDPDPDPIIATAYTSDTWTGGDAATIHGRTSDAGLGGAGQTWAGSITSSPGAVAISGGRLIHGENTSSTFYGITTPAADVQITAAFEDVMT